MRIGSGAPKRRTHSSNRHESQGACQESATSNRHRYPITSVRTGPKLSSASTSPNHGAGRETTPSGTTPYHTNRHGAISSLRAKATLISLRAPRVFFVRARYHRANSYGTLEIGTPVGPCLAERDHCRNGLT